MYICYHNTITNTKTKDVYHYFGRHRVTPEEYYGTGKFVKKCKRENAITPGVWEFSIEVVHKTDTFKEAKLIEEALVKEGIAKYGSRCVNKAPGGPGGVDFHSAESKRKMSISRTGKSRTFSESHKLNCSKWQRSEIWQNYEELRKIWIELGMPKKGRFSTLLQNYGYNYSANELNKIVKHFNEENNNE